MQDTDTYGAELRLQGLKVTRLRLAIMEVLHSLGRTATSTQLLERIQDAHSIHRTTVYRNLAALEEAKLVRRVPTGGREFVYELTCRHRPEVHPHFTCRQCAKVVCLSPVDLSSLWKLLVESRGGRAESAEVTLVGLCEECVAREEES